MGTPYRVSGDSRELIAVRSTRVAFFFPPFLFLFFSPPPFFSAADRIGWKGRMNASQRRCRTREDGFARVWIHECEDRSGIGGTSRDESVDVRSDGGLQ